MPPFLYVWLLRFGLGERLEPATPFDYRIWFGALFLTPVLLGTFLWLASPVMNLGTTTEIWLGITLLGVTTYFLTLLWARLVPARISLGMAVAAWVVAFLIMWHL